jgi:transcriptional regulator with XRE-family HTH domain
MRPFAREHSWLGPSVAEREAMVRIGTELRELREKRRMTLREVCAAVGVSAPFLSDVEHGRRRMSHVDEIARVLGVKPSHFYELAGLCPHCDGTGFAGVSKSKRRQ